MSSIAQSGARPRVGSRPIDASPYLVGSGIGVLCWIAFALAKEPLGVTTALSRVGQPAAALFLGADAVARNAYWGPMPFAWDYSVLFLVGIMAGAFACSLATRTFRFEFVPRFWRDRFGHSVLQRGLGAFLGGAALMYGARLAGGCASGHGLSGGLQLAVSSWLFLIVMFASAFAASALIFGRGARGAPR
jgi:uncharacterized protein